MKNVNRSKRTNNNKKTEVTTIEASGQCICPTENAICTSTLGSVAKLTSQHAMDYRMSEMRQTDSLKELKYSNNPLLAKWLFMQSFDRIRLRIFFPSSLFCCINLIRLRHSSEWLSQLALNDLLQYAKKPTNDEWREATKKQKNMYVNRDRIGRPWPAHRSQPATRYDKMKIFGAH